MEEVKASQQVDVAIRKRRRSIVANSLVILGLLFWFGPSTMNRAREWLFLNLLHPSMSREALYSLCRELHISPSNADYAVHRKIGPGSWVTVSNGDFPEPDPTYPHPDVSLDFYPTPGITCLYDIDQVHVSLDQSNRVRTWTKTTYHTGC